MLDKESYERLFKMQNDILVLLSRKAQKYSFPQMVNAILSQTLTSKYSMAGTLLTSGKKALTSSCAIQGLSMEFAQSFFFEYWENEGVFQSEDDRITFDSLPDAVRERFKKKVLNHNKFADFTVEFVKTSNEQQYALFFIVFSISKFTENELLLIDYIKQSIAFAYDNYQLIWNLHNQNAMLLNCANYFPIGIMLIDKVNTVSFTNDTAKRYLSDLGIISPKMYETFFINQLYNYCKEELLNFGAVQPIRIKNYLFSIVMLSNPGKNLATQFHRQGVFSAYMPNTMDISMCVYIIDDDIYHTRFDASLLQSTGLTKREISIAELITAGKSNQEIANQLMISVNTVRIHISNIFRKMNVKSRSQLVDKLINISEKQ